MKVVFRADAAVHIGSGHLMRCLALAESLAELGAEVLFICREWPGNLCNLVETKGYRLVRLPAPREDALDWKEDAREVSAVLAREQGADWVVVDHYQLDSRWEELVAGCARKLMVIDDLADRPHWCDLLLDQNLCAGMEFRYTRLVPAHCVKLLGPRYALLRKEFKETRQALRPRRGELKRVLVFFGGTDPSGETFNALQALQRLNREDLRIDVVTGGGNPARERIAQACASIPHASFYCQADFMARLMAAADLSMGAGGSTTWERCCLGLPALVTVLSADQQELTKAVAERGALINLGRAGQVTAETYLSALGALGTEMLHRMSIAGQDLADGDGCARVAAELLSEHRQPGGVGTCGISK